MTAEGFRSIEQIVNHPKYTAIHFEITCEGEKIRAVSQFVDKDGEMSDVEEGFVYTPTDDPGVLFSDVE